jgi:hypothetical protein
MFCLSFQVQADESQFDHDLSLFKYIHAANSDDANGITERKAKPEPGLLQDRPLGFRMESYGYSTYLLSYNNEFLEQFNGFVVNKSWRMKSNLLIEAGGKLDWVNDRKVQSLNASLTIPTPRAMSLNLRAKVNLIHTFEQGIVGVFDFKLYL